MNAGVMGLAVNSTKLSTISDNIANSETYGYKRADTEFTNLVISQGRGAYSAGGVRVTTFKDVAAQGGVVTTSNSTDISVAGRGLLPVTTNVGLGAGGATELLLTATGSFTADENGFLRTLSGLYLMGWPANADGTVDVPGRDSAAGLEPVNITRNQFAAAPTSTISLGVNLPASATQAGASGDPYELPIEYFDNLGRSQTLVVTFTPQVPATGATNTWTATVVDRAGADPNAVIATFDITFDDTNAAGGSIASVVDGAGATYDAATGEVSFAVASGPMSLFIGEPFAGGPMTQLSAEFSPVGVAKDGAPIGSLSHVEISAEGMLEAIYDNGFRRTIYQIPVADVPNMNGLRPKDNQTFAISQDSGLVYFWDAGSGPVGTTQGYSLAESTTDIASELTDLIETQRAYSSNAKIIQTVDEMLQETTNLKR